MVAVSASLDLMVSKVFISLETNQSFQFGVKCRRTFGMSTANACRVFVLNVIYREGCIYPMKDYIGEENSSTGELRRNFNLTDRSLNFYLFASCSAYDVKL